MKKKNGVGSNWTPYRHRRLHNDVNVYKRYQHNKKNNYRKICLEHFKIIPGNRIHMFLYLFKCKSKGCQRGKTNFFVIKPTRCPNLKN